MTYRSWAKAVANNFGHRADPLWPRQPSLSRFHPGSKAGQGDNGRSQQAKDGQGRERFDHLKLLTVAVSRSRRARGSCLQHPPRQGVPIIRPQAHDCLHHRRQIAAFARSGGWVRAVLVEPTALHSLTISTFRSDHPGKAAQNSAIANCAGKQLHWGREPIRC
jgi:hypothetical protein